MKKQLQILAAAFIVVAFISCSKEKTELAEPMSTINAETQTARSGVGRPNNDPLVAKLEGRFEFDGDLKDKTGKLPGGLPTSRGATKYGEDRKGNANKALFLDGSYGIKLSNVPQQTNTSLSVWLYIGNEYSNEYTNPVYGKGPSLYHFHQYNWYNGDHTHNLSGGIILSESNSNPWADTQYTTEWWAWGNWHHFVVTYDGIDLMFYMDGEPVGWNTDYPAVITPHLENYQLGFYKIAWNEDFWIGRMDDLRFYSHTLTPAEVQKVFNQ